MVRPGAGEVLHERDPERPGGQGTVVGEVGHGGHCRHPRALIADGQLHAPLGHLASDLHLVVLSTLVESFFSMPVSATPLGGDLFRQLVGWGGRIFSAGVQLALPVVAALLITNVALGVLTRAAPQLNLFGVGFPITLSVGFVMLALTVPYLAVPLDLLFAEAFGVIRKMTTALPKI